MATALPDNWRQLLDESNPTLMEWGTQMHAIAGARLEPPGPETNAQLAAHSKLPPHMTLEFIKTVGTKVESDQDKAIYRLPEDMAVEASLSGMADMNEALAMVDAGCASWGASHSKAGPTWFLNLKTEAEEPRRTRFVMCHKTTLYAYEAATIEAVTPANQDLGKVLARLLTLLITEQWTSPWGNFENFLVTFREFPMVGAKMPVRNLSTETERVTSVGYHIERIERTDESIRAFRNDAWGDRPKLRIHFTLPRSASEVHLCFRFGERSYSTSKMSEKRWDALSPAEQETRLLAHTEHAWPTASMQETRENATFHIVSTSDDMVCATAVFYPCSAGLEGGTVQISPTPISHDSTAPSDVSSWDTC